MYTPFPLNLGLRKDVLDERDFLYKDDRKMRGYLPPRFTVRDKMSRVYNQGALGSCTAFSTAKGAREALDLRDDNQFTPLSALYLYYHTRAAEGNIQSDCGATLRNAVKILSTRGCATHDDWLYDQNAFHTLPNQNAESSAPRFKIVEYHRLTTLEEMLRCLADGYPFVGGVSAYSHWYSKEVVAGGKICYPRDGDSDLGGHAICFTGYDVGESILQFKNSWGEDWGDKGYGYLPLNYVEKYGWDFWTMTK